MTALTKTLYIEAGSTFTLPFQWCEKAVDGQGNTIAGPPIPLDDWTGKMQVRRRVTGPALITATTQNGGIELGVDPDDAIPVVDLSTGWITVRLSALMTSALVEKTAVYDLEMTDVDGNVYRLLQGPVEVSLNVTRED